MYQKVQTKLKKIDRSRKLPKTKVVFKYSEGHTTGGWTDLLR